MAAKKTITAIHPKAKIPEFHICYEGRVIDANDTLIPVFAIIGPGGVINSIEEVGTGQLINVKGLKSKNPRNLIFNKEWRTELYKIYGFTKKPQNNIAVSSVQ